MDDRSPSPPHSKPRGKLRKAMSHPAKAEGGEIVDARSEKPSYAKELYTFVVAYWNGFWFTPADVMTLGVVRLLTGAMLLYTHCVWTADIHDFFGAGSWTSAAAVAETASAGASTNPLQTWAWSHWWWFSSPAAVWAVHLFALAVFALLMVGWKSRWASILAYLLAAGYWSRAPAAMFGLDQINLILAFYVMLGPSGDAVSVDRCLAAGQGEMSQRSSVGANVAVRLLQVHMCVIYFFAGAGKLAGSSWWDGTALWLAWANTGYQTVDLTWLAEWPRMINLLTTGSLLWELSFCVFIWPRLTRPVVLAGGVLLHLGIGISMGMMTFGLVMLIGCCSFIPPERMRQWLTQSPWLRWLPAQAI